MESNHNVKLRRPALCPLSYGTMVERLGVAPRRAKGQLFYRQPTPSTCLSFHGCGATELHCVLRFMRPLCCCYTSPQYFIGRPTEIRTPVNWLRTSYPSLLDDRTWGEKRESNSYLAVHSGPCTPVHYSLHGAPNGNQTRVLRLTIERPVTGR